MDGQVKIRGVRVEPGEVEVALARYPKVRQCAVVAQEGAGREQRLVAYLSVFETPPPPAAELRRFLAERLPDPLIPSSFLFCSELPLTPTGKVDRLSLQTIAGTDRHIHELRETRPIDPIEARLALLWRKLLDTAAGVNDNFFALGGTSYTAVVLLARVAEELGITVPLIVFFSGPTIEQLAEELRRRGGLTREPALVTLRAEGSYPPLFCVPPAASMAVQFQALADLLGPDQPFYALQPAGLDGHEPPQKQVEDMAAHYIREIRTVQPAGPYFLGGRCFGGLVAFEMAQQLTAAGEHVALLAIFDTILLPEWVHRGVRPVGAGDPIWHAFLRVFHHLRQGRISLVARAAWAEANILVNPRFRHVRRALNAHLWARAQYVPRPYPGKITLFRSGSVDRIPDYQRAWAGLAAGGLEACVIPGSHHDLMTGKSLELLARHLQLCLERARSRSEERAA
jgi:thioesterase domain-containing protein